MNADREHSVVFLTTADAAATPHAEWVPWALEQAGWRVTAVTPAGDASLVRNVLGARWECRTLLYEAALFLELLRARFGRAKVVYLHSQGLGWRAAAVFLGPRFGKRLVYHNPDYYDPIAYPIRAALERLLARRCDLVVSHEYHRGYIQRAHCRLRCPVLISPPNLSAGWPIPAFSAECRRQMTGGREDAFVLRLHGGFSPRRMVPQLFEALSILPARFRLAMTGPATEAAGLIARLGIEDRVTLLPRLDYNGMLEYSASADAGVLLYANNDLGNFFQAPGRLTEYLACGLPVVAPRFTGIENLVLRYGIGCCADPSNAEDLALAILALESDVRGGRLSRESVRASFEAHFAFDHWAPRVAAAFEQTLVAGRGTEQAPPPEFWFPEAAHE
jgi:glycosyltransferase involved in cell wall biosynthesis